MTASRKLYDEIAKSFKAALVSHSLAACGADRVEAIAQAARLVAGDLSIDNPRFDEIKFFAACGLTVTGEPGALVPTCHCGTHHYHCGTVRDCPQHATPN